MWGSRGSIPVSGPEYEAYGGDTTSLEVVTEAGETILFDAGSGIRSLGNRIVEEVDGPKSLYLLMTHAHLDHLLGFPFFKPIYRREYTIHVHGCVYAQESIQTFLRRAVRPPYFSVDLDSVAADLRLSGGCAEELEIGEVRVRSLLLNHPNGGYGFRVEEGDPDAGMPPGRAFEDLPEDWVCPICGVGKEMFEQVG